jgi:hypothetical protein
MPKLFQLGIPITDPESRRTLGGWKLPDIWSLEWITLRRSVQPYRQE